MKSGKASVAGPRRRARRGGGARATIRSLLLLLLLALLLRAFVFTPFAIASGSMLPAMMAGDYLFVAQRPIGAALLAADTPARGDIVFFRHPASGEDYVKRLIGLPGDTVAMQAGHLILNGKAVPKVRIADYLMPIGPNSPCRYVTPEAARPRVSGPDGTFCRYPRYRETLPGGKAYEVLDQWRGGGDDTDVYTVPEGHYFMMGDNRDDSADSRFEGQDGVGLVAGEDIVGGAALIFFSTDGSAAWLKPWTWASAARWDRVGSTL